MFTLGLLSIAPLARIVRAQTLTLREREFVLAARSLGAPTTRVLAREVLPNLVPTMLTVAFTGLGILVAAEGALAFLGLSVENPTPTWGKLIEENRDNMDVGWWATIFPCLLLFLTVLSFNVIGDAVLATPRHPPGGDLVHTGADAAASLVDDDPAARGHRPRHPLPVAAWAGAGGRRRDRCRSSAARRSGSSASPAPARPCSPARSWD